MNIDQMLTWAREHPTELTIAGASIGVLVFTVLVVMVIRALQGKSLNARASIGFGVVQAGVAWITITGVYEFFHDLLDMPVIEAGLLAAFIEACVWAAVGNVYAHAKGTDANGNPNVGFGPAGPFFWVTVCGGGTLAVLGSASSSVAIGRIVIVVLGAYMWYLRLLQVTHRSAQPSRWRWTPRRILMGIGALEPADEDVTNQAREWQIRRLARAVRWANSSQPWAWLGQRALVKRAETTTEDVLAEARRRWASAYLLQTHVKPDSPVMQAVIAEAQRAQLPELAIAAADQTPQLEVEEALDEPHVAESPRVTSRELVGEAPERDGEPARADWSTRELVPAAPARRPQGDVDRPTAAVVGNAVPAQPAPAEALSGAGRGQSMKEQAFAVLERHGQPEAQTQLLTKVLTGHLGDQIKPDTAARYVRDWRKAIAGRVAAGGRRLQLVQRKNR